MAESPRTILICSCEDTMPLDARAVKRGCRGARGHDRASALPRRARAVPRGRGRRRAAHRRLHAGGAAVRRGRREPRDAADPLRQHPRDRRLVERCRGGRSEDGGADRGRRRARARHSVRQLQQRGRDPDLRPRRARDRGGQPAQGPSRRHRADQAARRRGAAARHRFPGGARARSAPPRAISAPSSSPSTTMRSRRRRRAARSTFGAGARTARCRAATSCSTSPAARRCSPRPTCATAICAPIPAIRAAVLRRC